MIFYKDLNQSRCFYSHFSLITHCRVSESATLTRPTNTVKNVAAIELSLSEV